MPDDAAVGDDDRVDATTMHETDRGLIPQVTQDLAALRERLDAVQHDVAELVARLHTLDGAITGVETSLGDRLADYADTVVQLGRGLTSNVSTYREGNERTVSDLRRALADSEELLRAVLTKSDDLAVEIASMRRELSSDLPSDALDVDELRVVLHEALEPFDARAAIDRLSADVAALHERVRASTGTAETSPSTPDVSAAVQAEVLKGLDGVRTELQRLRRADARTPKDGAAVAREQALVAELHAIRDEITQLKRRIAVRAKAPTIDDEQLSAIASRIGATVDLRVPDADLDRLADAVTRRLSEAFELVPEDS